MDNADRTEIIRRTGNALKYLREAKTLLQDYIDEVQYLEPHDFEDDPDELIDVLDEILKDLKNNLADTLTRYQDVKAKIDKTMIYKQERQKEGIS